MAKAENLDRELHTQKEILKQMEMTKKEYIDKLKKELDTIEIRYQHLLNENCMIGEDFRSQARENKLYLLSARYLFKIKVYFVVPISRKTDKVFK